MCPDAGMRYRQQYRNFTLVKNSGFGGGTGLTLRFVCSAKSERFGLVVGEDTDALRPLSRSFLLSKGLGISSVVFGN
jgi:hypothetical protein